MKKRNFLCGFALSLTALVALGSCGMSKVTPEEGMKALDEIKSAYKNNQVIYPAAFTINDTVTHNTPTHNYKVKIIYSVDASNNTFYSFRDSTEDNENKLEEMWLYFENGYFYSVINDNGAKSYTKKEVKAEEENDYFVANSPWLNLLKIIGEASLALADKIIKDYNDYHDDKYLEEHYKNGKISVDGSFKSNGDGSFGIDNSVTFKDVVDLDLAMIVNGSHKQSVEYEEYVLSKFTMEDELTVANTTTYSCEDSTIALDAQFKKPNLNEFKQEI